MVNELARVCSWQHAWFLDNWVRRCLHNPYQIVGQNIEEDADFALTFFKDRESGMLARLTGTPMKKHEYILGMWAPNYIIVLIQVTLLYAFGHFYYKMSLGNLPALIIISLLLAFVGTALGLLLIFVSENQQTVIMLAQIVILGGAKLSGLLFSPDIVPSTIKKYRCFSLSIGFKKVILQFLVRELPSSISGKMLSYSLLWELFFPSLHTSDITDFLKRQQIKIDDQSTSFPCTQVQLCCSRILA